MEIDLSEWVKNVNIFASHVNVYQRVTSVKEDFQSQVAKKTHSVDTISFFLQTLLLPTDGLTHKVAMAAGMKCRHRDSDMDFHSQCQLGSSHCWVPCQPAADTKSEPPMWQHSEGWSASYLMAGWLHWTISIMERAALCSYWHRCLSAYINPTQSGLLMAQTLPEWRLGSPNQAKSQKQWRCLLRTKNILLVGM